MLSTKGASHKLGVGDHVELKGLGLTGYTGTVIKRKKPFGWYVQLDPGQVRGGHTVLHVTRNNLRRDTE